MRHLEARPPARVWVAAAVPHALDLGHLDEHRALGDDELDGVAAEQRAAGRGLRDHVALGDGVAVLLGGAVDLEAELPQCLAWRASASLPVQSGTLIGSRALADHEVDRGAALAARCRASGRLPSTTPLATRLGEAVRRVAVARGAASCERGLRGVEAHAAQRGHLVPLGALRRARRSRCRRAGRCSPPPGSVLTTEPAGDGLGVGPAADPERQPGGLDLGPRRCGRGQVDDAGGVDVAARRRTTSRRRPRRRRAAARAPAASARAGSGGERRRTGPDAGAGRAGGRGARRQRGVRSAEARAVSSVRPPRRGLRRR